MSIVLLKLLHDEAHVSLQTINSQTLSLEIQVNYFSSSKAIVLAQRSADRCELIHRQLDCANVHLFAKLLSAIISLDNGIFFSLSFFNLTESRTGNQSLCDCEYCHSRFVTRCTRQCTALSHFSPGWLEWDDVPPVPVAWDEMSFKSLIATSESELSALVTTIEEAVHLCHVLMLQFSPRITWPVLLHPVVLLLLHI